MLVACLPLCAFFFALLLVLFLALLVYMASDDKDEEKGLTPTPPSESNEPKEEAPK
jgi:hypothetical protein